MLVWMQQAAYSHFTRCVIVVISLLLATITSEYEGTRNLAHCNSTQLAFGRWVWSVDNDTAKISHCGMATVYDHRLDEVAGNHDDASWGKYCWRPHNCRYHKYSVERACHVLGGHGVLIIGDSTSYMFYQSIFMQLLSEGQPRKQHDDSDSFDLICGGKARLKFVRNDLLSGNRAALDPLHLDWVKHITDFDIVVANKGCHIDHGDFAVNTVASAIEFAKYMNSPNKTFIYRTTPQPHPYCTEDAVANTNALLSVDQENFVHYDEMSAFNEYEWYRIPSRDIMSLSLYRKHIPSMEVLDVAPMTSLRPDGHRAPTDCLHYYLPSVVDQWVFMFYNLLLIHFGHPLLDEGPLY